jgi:hypothetical protein
MGNGSSLSFPLSGLFSRVKCKKGKKKSLENRKEQTRRAAPQLVPLEEEEWWNWTNKDRNQL